MAASRAAIRKSTASRGGRERITISLSPDKVRFLKSHSRKRGVQSVSALVERLISEAQRREQYDQLNAHVSQYYDSLSEQEREEQRNWGELGALALTSREE